MNFHKAALSNAAVYKVYTRLAHPCWSKMSRALFDCTNSELVADGDSNNASLSSVCKGFLQNISDMYQTQLLTTGRQISTAALSAEVCCTVDALQWSCKQSQPKLKSAYQSSVHDWLSSIVAELQGQPESRAQPCNVSIEAERCRRCCGQRCAALQQQGLSECTCLSCGHVCGQRCGPLQL